MENESKHEKLKKVMAGNQQEQVIVMGDMNGHVGVLGKVVNRNSNLLLEFVEENSLEIVNVTLPDGRVTYGPTEYRSLQ